MWAANLFEINDASQHSLISVDANGHLGIGTTSPTNALIVNGTSTFNGLLKADKISITQLGVNTDTPDKTLTVQGTARVTGDARFEGGVIISAVTSCEGGSVLETDGNGRIICGQDDKGPAAAPVKDKGEILDGQVGYLPYYTGGKVLSPSAIFYDDVNARVGIGTTTPFAMLSIASSTRQQLMLTDPSATADQKHWYASSTKGSLTFGTVADNLATSSISISEKIRITNAGLFGIGTTSPAQLLSVQGNVLISGTTTMGALIATSTVGIGTSTPSLSPLSVTAQGGLSAYFAGSVGIGTANPAVNYQLHVANKAGDAIIRIEGSMTNSSYISFRDTDAANTNTYFGTENSNGGNIVTGSFAYSTVLSTADARNLQFGTNNAVRMTITPSGAVGMGTTTPGGVLSVSTGSTSPAFLLNQTSTGDLMTLQDSGITRFNILDGGNVGISTTTPGSLFSIQGVGNFVSGATSTIYTGVNFPTINATSTTATSTFANGIQLSGGCFKTANGNCAISGAAGGTFNPGIANRLTYYSGTNTLDSANFLTVDTTTARLGISTSTPSNALSVMGSVYLDTNFLTIGSTTGAQVGTASSSLTIHYRQSATTTFATSSINAFSFAIATNTTPILSIDTLNSRIGVGTGTPGSLLSVQAGDFQVTGTSTMHALVATSTLFVGSTGSSLAVLSSGNVGIGTTSPGTKLEIGGTNASIRVLNDGGSPTIVSGDTTNDNVYIEWRSATNNGRIQTQREGIGAGALELQPIGGNVGIGTVNPIQALHVVGQCVTGDTLLKRKRRRRKKNAQGEWVEEEYFENVRIDEIKAGDEILTLDEHTGKLVISKVNALMDMGVKEIYKLTTALGKTIRTTAEHPYLVRQEKENQKAPRYLWDSLTRWAVDLHHTRVNEPFGFQPTTQLLGFTHQTHRIYQYNGSTNKNNTLISEGGVFSPLMSAAPLTETLISKYSRSENLVKS